MLFRSGVVRKTVVLARSTDHGHSFSNYAWTTEAFEASDVFFGDYSGIAAYGGRVYGIWTEKPAPEPAAPDTKTQTEEKKPKPQGTIVKVGVADFGSTR